jgi:HEAT repeat protein
MGTNALPVLTQMLRVREPDWRWWLRQQRWFPFRLRGQEQVPLHAGFGFACLREQAVPALEQLLTNSQTTANGAIALGRMAPVGATALVRGLTNDDWYVRYWCAAVFSGVGAVDQDRNDCEARVGETARLAVPALIVRLSDTNAEVARTAARALANLGGMPEPVLPALASASTNSALDASVRASAAAAFSRLNQRDLR